VAARDLASRSDTAAGLARLAGFARSLAIYHGRPRHARRLRAHYGTLLGPGDLAFDVGAHVGDRARCWAALGARVVAIEPQPRFAVWLRWLFRRTPGVTVVETALGAEAGTATLYESPRTPTVTTLSRPWAETVGRASSFAGVRWQAQREVPVTTLDALIARFGSPRFCKIDVEGYEALVLAGLSTPLPLLSFEVVPAADGVARAALDRLEALGDHRFNVTLGERHRFLWPDWRPAAGVRRWLAARRPDDDSGDIYARRVA